MQVTEAPAGQELRAVPTGIFVGVGALMRRASLAGGHAALGILVGGCDWRHAGALSRLCIAPTQPCSVGPELAGQGCPYWQPVGVSAKAAVPFAAVRLACALALHAQTHSVMFEPSLRSEAVVMAL